MSINLYVSGNFMVTVRKFEDTRQFLDYNKPVIDENYFVFYQTIMTMLSPEIENIFTLYNLQSNDGANAYCLWMTGHYIIHSFKWDDQIEDALLRNIDFKRFTRFTFLGQKQLLLSLLNKADVSYEVEKDRLVYECERTVGNIETLGRLQVAEEKDLPTLSQMSFQYTVDEYKGKSHRDLAYMTNIVKKGIEHKNIYKLVHDGEIKSMGQVISEDYGLPLIGQLFTNRNERGKGFASSFLSQLTNKLFRDGHKKCGLLSDVTNESSNAVFQKVGYVPIYEQISVYKK